MGLAQSLEKVAGNVIDSFVKFLREKLSHESQTKITELYALFFYFLSFVNQ